MGTCRRFATAALALSIGILTACSASQTGFLGQMLPATDSRPAAIESGALEIQIAPHRTGGRAVQATIADIHHVSFDLQAPKGVARSQDVQRADMGNGGASATARFTFLWPGVATVSVAAFDARSGVIGSAAGTASVRPGEATVLELAMTLSPTYITAGDLIANLNVKDGPEILLTPSPGPSTVLPPIPTPTPAPTYSSLGTFAPLVGKSLTDGRESARALRVGNRVYVLGGDNGSGALSTIEEAEILPDGTMGGFLAYSGSRLTRGRYGFGLFASTSFVYAIGGDAGGAALGSVERAAINADGTLGTFSTVPGGNLSTPRSGLACFALGNWLYVAGGFGYPGNTYASAERAPILADGSLGSFTTYSPTSLKAAREGAAVAVFQGRRVFLVGGYDLGANYGLASVEAADLLPDGNLGPFSLQSSLTQARDYGVAVAVGSSLYVLNGSASGRYAAGLTSIEVAQIGADGSLSPFSVATNGTTTSRYSGASLETGNYLYLIGGLDRNRNFLSSVEGAQLQ